MELISISNGVFSGFNLESSTYTKIKDLEKLFTKQLLTFDETNNYSIELKSEYLKSIYNNAVTIISEYRIETSKLNWFNKKTACWNEEPLMNTFNKLLELVSLSSFPISDQNIFNEIAKYLTVSDIGRLATVNRTSRIFIFHALVARSRKLKSTETDSLKSIEYLKELVLAISGIAKFLVLNDSPIAVKDPEILLDYIQNLKTEGIFNLFSINEVYNLPLKNILFEKWQQEEVLSNEIKNAGGNTLMHAATFRQLSLVKTLLSLGANPDGRTVYNFAALHAAAQYGYRDIAEILLVFNADINSRCGGQGNTPLKVACEFQQWDMANYLLEMKANPNMMNNMGLSPMNYICCYWHLPTAENLIKNGINLDTMLTGDKGVITTCLIWSCLNQQLEFVKLFLLYGANPNLRDNENKTALWHAMDKKNVEITKLLLEHGATL